MTYYTLFVIELKIRLVHTCGSTPNPDGEWILQIARNLTDCETGFAVGKSHLIRNHQGVDNELLTPKEFAKDGPNECQSELGGMLNFYYRKAAYNAVG